MEEKEKKTNTKEVQFLFLIKVREKGVKKPGVG